VTGKAEQPKELTSGRLREFRKATIEDDPKDDNGSA